MAPAHGRSRGIRAHVARLRHPGGVAGLSRGHRRRLQPRAARDRRFLPRAPPHPLVGRVPLLPRDRDQRRHHHRGAGHGVQRELGVRAVLRGLEPGEARRRLPLHPGLLPLRLHDHLRVPALPLRPGQPGDGLGLLLHHAPPGIGGAAHGRRPRRRAARRLAALGDDRALHRGVDRLHRARRGQGRRVDQRLPGVHVPRRRRADSRIPRLAGRRRPGRHAGDGGRSGAPERDQLGPSAGRARFPEAGVDGSQHLLARDPQRLHRLDGRLRHRLRPHAAPAHRRDAR